MITGINTIIINAIDNAEPNGQFLALRNWFWIRFPTIIVLAPPKISGVIKVPNTGIKTNKQPANIPRIVNGKMIRKKVRKSLTYVSSHYGISKGYNVEYCKSKISS